MDPNTAYDLMTDTSADDAERVEAAAALDGWITRGGFLPSAPWSTVPDADRRRIIRAECAAIARRDPVWYPTR